MIKTQQREEQRLHVKQQLSRELRELADLLDNSGADIFDYQYEILSKSTPLLSIDGDATIRHIERNSQEVEVTYSGYKFNTFGATEFSFTVIENSGDQNE